MGVITTRHREWKLYGKLSLEQSLPILEREFGTVVTVNTVQAYFRKYNILNEENEPIPPFDDGKCFDYNLQRIYSPYGRRVAYNNKLMLTLEGYFLLADILSGKVDVEKIADVYKQKPDSIIRSY